MVVLLVALTFVVLISVGAYLEHREKQAAVKEAGSLVAQPMFAQDGGEPVESKHDSDASETEC